jgi:tripartite-type tricarboxylate transporter receptor subunit TctC
MNKLYALLSALALSGTALALSATAHAQPYPNKPVRMIIGYAAGSGADIGGRVVAEGLSEYLKVPVVVENRPGGNVQIAINAMRQADADGYTIMWGGAAPMSVQPLMDPKLVGLEKSWDPTAEFATAGFVARYDGVYVTGGGGPKTLRELIERAKTPKNDVSFGTYSAGSTFDLAQEYLMYMSAAQATPIRYKGGAEITNDLITGRLTLSILTLAPTTISLVKEGKLRPLAVLSKERLSLLPEAPSLPEAGFAEMLEIDWDAWFGVFARKSTPAAAMDKLNEATRRMLADANHSQKMLKVGMNPYQPASLRDSQARWDKSFAATRVMLGKLGLLPK